MSQWKVTEYDPIADMANLGVALPVGSTPDAVDRWEKLVAENIADRENRSVPPLPFNFAPMSHKCPHCGVVWTGEWPSAEPHWTIAECNVIAADGHLPMLYRTLAYRLAQALTDLALLRQENKK